MSPLINDILAKYARDKQRPLMFIASRNQVDAASGYVMTTAELAQQLAPLRSPYLMLCRDHCGPYFLDSEKSLSESDAVKATKRTIAADIEAGFDLIHIDTSRCSNGYATAEELIKFALMVNPQIQFEFGTEENVGVAAGVQKYKDDVDFAKHFPNMRFVVAQTGSLTYEDRQAGSFEYDTVLKLVDYADVAGVGLKEHNADYLTAEEIALRRSAGVHALNIAPQLGVIQTNTVLSLAQEHDVDSSEFRQRVIDSGKWTKWTESADADLRVKVAGHYLFNSAEYNELEERLSLECDVIKAVQENIESCLDLYYTNLY